ncbi:MAG: GNAT family N-acetyltransferase [Flavobacteriales bacterium]|nr:GNAT family N-acetyltransferase [Flavobacteriales bacterium]
MLIRVADSSDKVYAEVLCSWYEESAKQRGIGIAKRKPEYIEKKMTEGDAVVAFDDDGEFVGFCYIETFDNKSFVVNSGLIIKPELRKAGLGKKIKMEVFRLSRTKYPRAKIFGITTSFPVMKINTEIGYHPVTFSELTTSDEFWNGCKSCKNYHILMENERKMCLCTAMVYDKIDSDKYSEGGKEHQDYLKERYKNYR